MVVLRLIRQPVLPPFLMVIYAYFLHNAKLQLGALKSSCRSRIISISTSNLPPPLLRNQLTTKRKRTHHGKSRQLSHLSLYNELSSNHGWCPLRASGPYPALKSHWRGLLENRDIIHGPGPGKTPRRTHHAWRFAAAWS